MARKLTVVTDETPPAKPKPPANIKEAVERSERELLVAMRRKVASEIDAGVPAHALAPLLRQMRELDKEIRALDARDEQEGLSSGPTEDEAWTAI
jgi:hypothetical protein